MIICSLYPLKAIIESSCDFFVNKVRRGRASELAAAEDDAETVGYGLADVAPLAVAEVDEEFFH